MRKNEREMKVDEIVCRERKSGMRENWREKVWCEMKRESKERNLMREKGRERKLMRKNRVKREKMEREKVDEIYSDFDLIYRGFKWNNKNN